MLVPFLSYSQKVKIFTSSDSAQVKIKANSTDAFFTSGGTYKYADIVRIEFLSTPKKAIVEKLEASNIPYTYTNSNADPMYAKRDDSEAIQVQGNTIKSEAINGFSIKNKRVYYERVFETTLKIEALKENIIRSLKIDVQSETGNTISGFIISVDPAAFARDMGYNNFNMPSGVFNYLLFGNIDVQIKEGRYRITLSNIVMELQSKMTTGFLVSEKGKRFNINDASLNSSGIFRKAFVKTSKVYDYSFEQIYNFNTIKAVLDDDF